MVSSKILFFFFLVSITSMAVSTAEEPLLLYEYCAAEEKGNSNSNSTVQKTYNQNLKTLSTAQIDNGFYNSSSGEGNSSSIGLCRPDIPAETCRGCLKNVTESLWNACPSSKVAIGGEDNCMFRYSNRSILGEMETGPYFWVYNLNNVTDVNGFNKSRTTLLRRLAGEASGEGDSRYKYSMGQIGAPNSQNIYAMVQCTPDLTKMECSSCLNQAIDLVPKCCNERQGGRVIMPSCNFRYEIDLFYDPISRRRDFSWFQVRHPKRIVMHLKQLRISSQYRRRQSFFIYQVRHRSRLVVHLKQEK